jgi:two-component system sensor histidine kinase CreC
MSIGSRIFLAYLVFVALAGWFVLHTVMEEIKPGVRQSTEETLVDTAHLLAEILRDEMRAGRVEQSRWPELLRAYGQRQPQARIWGVSKLAVDHRIYVTDERGRVLLDSRGDAVGQDYARWNDVYLTLRGEYGARTTREDPENPTSTVMYVAAPIVDGERILGVVSVAKPNRTLQPYIDRSRRRLTWLGGGLIGLGLLLGGGLSLWLTGSLRRLTGYARAVSAGERVRMPRLRGAEMAQLARALEQMRTELEGQAYVERYVHALTHELKSPLAAIRGAAELLESEMPAGQKERFLGNIRGEAARLEQLVERLLHLALVEQRRGLEERVRVSLEPLAAEQLRAHEARITAGGVHVDSRLDPAAAVLGERFLLEQALANLLENALDFTPPGGQIRIQAERLAAWIELRLFNQGPPIPDYALPRLTERFFSLPRPATGRKSTGLGLSFVQEVAGLHGGELSVRNVEGGVEVLLRLPAA